MRAATKGSLWVLEREAFRGVLLMKYMHRPSLRILRSVEIFSKLSLSHLQRISDALTELTFEEGQVIVDGVSTPKHKTNVECVLHLHHGCHGCNLRRSE